MTLALGYPHPRYLQKYLSSQDITEWMTYAKAYPLPGARMSYMLGTIASLLYNSNKGKDQPYRGWDDFFPTMDAELAAAARKQPPTREQVEAQDKMVVHAFNAYNQRVAKKE